MANKRPPRFYQGDPRWGSKMYSKRDPHLTIRNNGCGPTAMSMLVALHKDKTMTPAKMAKLFVDNGFCAETHGTKRTAFAWAAARFGYRKFIRTKDTVQVEKLLEQGWYGVALMGKGFWTGGGHYIVIYWYTRNNNLIHANDPASSKRTSATGSLFARERKDFFMFLP